MSPKKGTRLLVTRIQLSRLKERRGQSLATYPTSQSSGDGVIRNGDSGDRAAAKREQWESDRAREERDYLDSLIGKAVVVRRAGGRPQVEVGTMVRFSVGGGVQEGIISGLKVPFCKLDGLLSTACPIAKAMLGHRVGDRVMAEVPSGEVAVQIISIWALKPVSKRRRNQ